MARTSILLRAWSILYCVSLALSVSCLVFCFCFSLLLPAGLLSLNSLFPSMYDIDGCATLAASFVFRMGFYFVTTGWIVLDQLG